MTINVWGKLEIMSRIEGVNNFNLPRVNKENVLFARSAIGRIELQIPNTECQVVSNMKEKLSNRDHLDFNQISS